MATGATILTRAEGVMKFDRTTVGVPGLEETQLLAIMSAANNEWVEAFKKGGGEPQEYMQGETGGTIVSDTDLDGAVATTDTEIDVTSASDLDSSGAIVVYDDEMPDIIEYTGKSSNQLTGVTGIGFAHEDEDAVSKLYALPSDFNDFRQQNDYGDGVLVANTPYTYTSGVPYGSQFSVYDNGTTTYLWLPRNSSGDFSVLYNKTTTTISATTDSINIPDKEQHNQWFVVYRMCEYIAPLLELDSTLYKVKADQILAAELKKRYVGKRPKLVRKPISMGGRKSYYNTAVGSRGISL